MTRFELTSPSLNDPIIRQRVTAFPDFMALHEVNYAHARQLQLWHDSQLERGVIHEPNVKMLRESFLFMKSASAFATMHQSPTQFLQMMAMVNKRG